MRGSKAKALRQLVGLTTEYETEYNEYQSPQFQAANNGMILKVAKGIPLTMKDTCLRKQYQKLKQAIRN